MVVSKLVLKKIMKNHETTAEQQRTLNKKCANTISMTLYLLLKMFGDKPLDAETVDTGGLVCAVAWY